VCINDAKIVMFLWKHNHVVVYTNNTLDQLKYVYAILYGLKFYDKSSYEPYHCGFAIVTGVCCSSRTNNYDHRFITRQVCFYFFNFFYKFSKIVFFLILRLDYDLVNTKWHITRYPRNKPSHIKNKSDGLNVKISSRRCCQNFEAKGWIQPKRNVAINFLISKVTHVRGTNSRDVH
jgi:hypothetical protein